MGLLQQFVDNDPLVELAAMPNKLCFIIDYNDPYSPASVKCTIAELNKHRLKDKVFDILSGSNRHITFTSRPPTRDEIIKTVSSILRVG